MRACDCGCRQFSWQVLEEQGVFQLKKSDFYVGDFICIWLDSIYFLNNNADFSDWTKENMTGSGWSSTDKEKRVVQKQVEC